MSDDSLKIEKIKTILIFPRYMIFRLKMNLITVVLTDF
jgi:hypothetical protein